MEYTKVLHSVSGTPYFESKLRILALGITNDESLAFRVLHPLHFESKLRILALGITNDESLAFRVSHPLHFESKLKLLALVITNDESLIPCLAPLTF